MAVRASMSVLIARLRDMIDDPAGVDETFYDDQLQDYLDASRDDVYGEPLETVGEKVGGLTLYRTHYSRYQHWETDATLADGNGETLTPSASAPMGGRWTFTSGQPPPVYATGRVYDLNAAAADALDVWAAQMSGQYDFSADGATFKRGQLAGSLRGQAANFRRMARVRTARVVTSDA